MSVRVRTIEPGLIHEGRATKTNKIIEVPAAVADEWVGKGWVKYTIRIRALVDNVLAAGRVLARGEEIEVSEHVAVRLHNLARAVVVDPRELADRSALDPHPKAPASPPEKPGIYEGMRSVKVRVIARFFAVDHEFAPNEGEVSVPEVVAVRAIHQGNAELAPLSHLSDRGSAYLYRLRNPEPEFAASY